LRIQRRGRIEQMRSIRHIKLAPSLQMLQARFRMNALKFRWHEPREGGRDRLHTQLAHARDDLVLKLHLLVEEFFRRRPVPAVDVPHPMPRIIRGSGKVSVELSLREAKTQPHALPD